MFWKIRAVCRLSRTAAAACCVGLVLPAAVASASDRAFTVAVTGPPSASPIIFIPGLMSAGEVWSAAAVRYSGAHRVHVLTLAGFAGQPPIDADPYLARVRDDVIDYIRAERLGRVLIVGHSLGAFVGFWVAATVPDLVSGLVAVDGVPFLPALSNPEATPQSMASVAAQLRGMFQTMPREQFTIQSRLSLPALISGVTDIQRAERWAVASDPSTVGRAMAEMYVTDLRDRVGVIRSPVLLIGAAKGATGVALESATESYRAQVRRVPQARVAIATGALHFVMLDDPSFFHAEVDRVLAEVGAGR